MNSNKHWLRTNLRDLSPEDQVKKWIVIILILAVGTWSIPRIFPRTPITVCKSGEQTIATRLTVRCVKP